VRVAVIGGAGRMGTWLVRYFTSKGYEVTLSDVRRDEAKEIADAEGTKVEKDNLEAAKNADLVVVSTPIEVTPRVLCEIRPGLRRPVTVMEISSLKSDVIPVLEEISRRGAKTLSVHPLFGPGVQDVARERMALIPVSDPASELEMVRSLFPRAEIVVVNAEEHDRAMALSLSLPHFVNIAFASVIGEEDLDVLKKLGGTTFKLQLAVSEGVMTEDPRLYASIQMSNKYTVQYLDKLLSRATSLRRHIDGRDPGSFLQFYSEVRASLSKDREFSRAYERMYRALQAL